MLMCMKMPLIGTASPAMGDNNIVGLALIAMGAVFIIAVAALLFTRKKR